MTISTRDIDIARAAEFIDLGFDEANARVEKYRTELDAELLDDIVKLANYVILREQGAKPVWAKMSACRKCAPMNGSDQDFNRGERRKMNSLNPIIYSRMEHIAKRAGISTQGKFYVGALGYYDNPKAWVSTADDVRESAKMQGYDLYGTIDVKAEPLVGTKKNQAAVKNQVPRRRKSGKRRAASVSAS